MPLIKARSSSIMESVDLRGTPTTATATAATNTTQVASTAFVKTNIANLVNSAPAALDTLNELALALNSDSSFSATITTALAAKLALAGGTMTGLITLSGAPTSGLHATTKTYVDAGIAAITLTNSDGLTEGSTNLYFTNARARGAISLSGNNANVLAYNSSTGTLTFAWPTTDGVSEGSNNLFHTTARVRTNISLTTSDSGLLGYNSTTGVFTFANPDTDDVAEGSNLYHTTARARAALSAGTNIAYDSATGVISSTSAVTSVNGSSGVVVLTSDSIAEGSTNLYATNARARGAISLTTSDSSVLAYNSGTGVITFTKPTTDGITEGSTNLYHSAARARAAITVSGDLTYASGVVGFALSNHDTDDVAEGSTNLYATNARARAAITLTTDSAALAYNGSTGVLTYSKPDSDAVAEGATNQYFTNARGRAAVSVTDAGGDGSMTYNSSTGVFTYTGPSASEVRAHVSATTSGTGHGSLSVTAGAFTFAKVTAANIRGELSAGTGVSYDSTTGIISSNASDLDTDDIAEGATNLYFTNTRARAAVSATDAGGDGSLSYNSSTGVFTYTGPSASEVRAHISAGTGVTITAGAIAIGQAVGTTDSVTFDDVTVNGDLTVNGTVTTLNSTTVDIDDLNITLAKGAATSTAANGAGLTIDGASATMLYTHATTSWNFNKPVIVSGNVTGTTFIGNVTGNVTGTVSTLSNHDTDDVAEGSTNLYATNARARAAVSATDAGGDGSFVYDSATGAFTYTGPSAAEARVHVSVTDAGGDGSLSYNSSTGVFTYTGPSASEARAHFSATTATGVTVTAGVIALASIPNSSLTNSGITINGTSVALGGTRTLDTDSVAEGSTNLYHSSARARAAITVSGDLTYANGVVGFALSNHDTADLAEGTNLYFTNTRARSAVSLTTDDTAVLAYNSSTGVLTFAIAGVNTDKVVEGATNQYFTTARARSSISVAGSGSYNSSTGVITVTGGVSSVNGATGVVVLSTDEVTEGSTNLYATNARARAAITLTTDGAALAYNSSTGVLTYAKPNTDAVAEGSTNLYHTTARVNARIAAASIADLADVGSIASIIDGYALVWSASTSTFVPQNVATTATSVTFTGDGSTLSFSTGVEVLSIQNTQVFINGLVQAPTYSYTLSTTASVTSVVFDTAPETSDYIFIRVTSISALTGDGILNEDSTIDGGSY